MAAAATAPTLFLVPSLGFSSPSSSSSTSSTSSLFFTGSSHLLSHKNFAYVSLTSLKFRTKASTYRFRPVINASGDYYATLGIPKSATNKEIKAAYRRLARQVLLFNFSELLVLLLVYLVAEEYESQCGGFSLLGGYIEQQ